MDRPPYPHPLVVGLPWSCELVPPVGAVLSAEGSEATPLLVDFFGSCTTCWYGIAGHTGSGWRRGSANVGSVGACWARPPGHCAICALAFHSIAPLTMAALLTPGRPGGAAGNPPDGEGLRRWQPPTREIYGGEAQWRCDISRHPCCSGTRSGHASRGGSHSIPWCLLHYLAPQLGGGSQLVGSHACAPGAQVVTVMAKSYSCQCL